MTNDHHYADRHEAPPPPDLSVEDPGGWREHSRPNLALRRKKAEKIVALVETRRPMAGTRVLEIGTGSGAISAVLADAVGPDGRVDSIDTMDTRMDSTGYEFQVISGVELPFEDATFDVVVSNHVVEHVGDRTAQQTHLDEIARVLRPAGVGYLATPTRWAIREPHFKVPFLSWLPRRHRHRYVQLAKAGTVYDVDPYARGELGAALDRTGLRWTDETMTALTEVGRIEQPKGAAGLLVKAPAAVRRAARPALPTMVFLLEKPR